MDKKEFSKSLDRMFDELKLRAAEVFPNPDNIEEMDGIED